MAPAPRPDLPGVELSCALAAWLAGPRGRLLRRAQIGLRQRVLEVGCGHGILTPELVRRCPGEVVSVDRDIGAAMDRQPLGAHLVAADAAALPFPDASFDLTFFENVLMWVSSAEDAVREAARVLATAGALVGLEPDFGGMMECPPEIALRDIWLRALADAGADPQVGRKLPSICEAVGLDVWVELQARPRPANAASARLLDGLPLSTDDRARVAAVERVVDERTGGWDRFVHVPYFLIVATKR